MPTGSVHTKLQPCSEWEKAQHGLFQAANVLLAVSLLVPHHTFRWSIFVTRILMGLAYAVLALWAWLDLCALDVLVWNGFLTVATSAHVVYWSWKFRPDVVQPHLAQLYAKLFQPLGVDRELFVQVTANSCLKQLDAGDDYVTLSGSGRPPGLSILLSGKLAVTYSNRLLHEVRPLQFADSPEWYSTAHRINDAKTFRHSAANVKSTMEKQYRPQVTVTVIEPSTILQLDPDHLCRLTNDSPSVRLLLDCIIGKDVSEKLYAVAEQQQRHRDASGGQHQQRSGRISSLQVGGFSTGGETDSLSLLARLHCDKELLRSQSADAVHTGHFGQVRSIYWRRDQIRREWARKYVKLVPTCPASGAPQAPTRNRRTQPEEDVEAQHPLISNNRPAPIHLPAIQTGKPRWSHKRRTGETFL